MATTAVKSRQSEARENDTKRTDDHKKPAILKDDPTTPIMLSEENVPKENTAIPKYYTFNETGNIMIATTFKDSGAINSAAMDMFEEVAVFFAAMTKAMQDKKKDLYDYDALHAIVTHSGMFIDVDQEDYTYKQISTSMSFNTQFISAVLGIAATDGAAIVFAQKLLQTLGKQVDISVRAGKSEDKVGHLLFVCEYLMGLPLVSAQLFEIDTKTAHAAFKAGPCASGKSYNQAIKFNKATYMFVLPKFLRQYSADLASVGTDADFGQLVSELEEAIGKGGGNNA